MTINISEVVLVLPPLGLEIFQKETTTNVVSSSGKISSLDISNVITILKKEKIPHNNSIVDVIPETFTTDDERVFNKPPLDIISNALSVKAKIHTLPKNIIEQYVKVVRLANLEIKSMVVAPFAISRLLKNNKEIPNAYLFADIGSDISSISLVKNGELYGSAYFLSGGKKLSENISNNLHISFEESEQLKKSFGFDMRDLGFNPVLLETQNNNQTTKVFLKDYNNEVLKYLLDYTKNFEACLNTVMAEYDNYASLPIVIGGGGSRLIGIVEFLQQQIRTRKIYPIPLNIIGARHQSKLNCLGAIKIANEFRGTIDETKKVSQITRDNNYINVKK